MTRASIVGAILVALLFATSGPAFASEDEHSLEQLVVEMADTPEQHAALAEHYRSKAAAARSEMQQHQRMGKSYMRGKMTERNAMKRHCQKIADEQESLAAEYEALAKLHEKEAKAK